MPSLMEEAPRLLAGAGLHSRSRHERDTSLRTTFQTARNIAIDEERLDVHHEERPAPSARRAVPQPPRRGRSPAVPTAPTVGSRPFSSRRTQSSFNQSSSSAMEHFARATSSDAALDRNTARSEGKKDTMSSSMTKNFKGVAHLTDELDDLFAEMGRQNAQLRAGHRSRLRLIPNITRTLEVRLPRKPDSSEEMTAQIECRCDPQHHATNEDEGRQKGLRDEEEFSIQVAESQRQVPDGPFRAQSLLKPTHRLRFVTDGGCLYVVLSAKKECRLEFFCRVWQGAQGPTERDKANTMDEDEEDNKQLTSIGASVGMKLQVKLKSRRQEHKYQKDKDDWNKSGEVSSPTMATSSTALKGQYKGRSFAEYIWEGSKPPRDEQQVNEAKRRVLMLMMGPCNKFTRFRRAKGQWVHKLSPECPKKIVKWLRKAVEDRGALTSLAVVGAFQFFWKRQRELHLMRARTAMRQLVWYKALFAASRFQRFMVIVAKGRQEAKKRLQERKAERKSAGRRTIVSVEKDSDSDEDTPVEEVRKCCDMLKKTKANGSARAGGGQSQPTSPAKSGKGLSSTAGSMLSPAAGSTIEVHRSGKSSKASAAGVDEGHKPRRGQVSVEQLLESRLASQGFIMYPHQGAPSGYEHVMTSHNPSQGRVSPGAQQRNFVNDISQTLGRHLDLHTPPLLGEDHDTSGDEDQQKKRIKALSDVNNSAHIVKVKPDELEKLKVASPGSKTKQIGNDRFKQYFHRSRERAAETLIRREEKLSPRIGDESVKKPVKKITKRYLLQFFETERSDLPWLPLMQTLMLVIHGQAHFHICQEHNVFQTKLRSFNQVRKAAQRKPGLFPPIEATLWSHPVILQIATKLQRAMCRGDGALAWKNSLFDGCFENSSERDNTGACFYSAARVGDEKDQLLRKLAEISGQFAVDTREGEPPPLAAELTPFPVTTAANSTSAGTLLRTFGDRDASDAAHQTITRYCDKALELPHDVLPKDIRIDTLRRRRRERDATGPREGHPLIAHSDLQAQERYGRWMMRSAVPAAAKKSKAEMLPYFESLVSPTAATFSSPRGSIKQGEPRKLLQESSEVDARNATNAEDSALAQATAAVSAAADAVGVAAAPSTAQRTMEPSIAKTTQEPSASLPQATDPRRGPASDDQSAAKSAGNSKTAPAPATATQTVSISTPQTAEDVGKLFLQMDALQTILEVDSSEIGGFAHRCPAGWRSGYRAEPMAKDEIRKAHIVQKFCAGSKKAAAPHI